MAERPRLYADHLADQLRLEAADRRRRPASRIRELLRLGAGSALLGVFLLAVRSWS